MSEKADMIGVIVDMLQRISAREVRFVYVLLSTMTGEEATAE